jgi:hypothetical protein
MCRNHSSQSLFKKKESHRLHASILMGSHVSHFDLDGRTPANQKVDGSPH